MGYVNCAVVNCRNNSYQLKLWEKKLCYIHQNWKKEECGCAPPYRLYCFPSNNRYKEKREIWTKIMKRVGRNKSPWYPKPSDRVCSDHFVDKIPTAANPDPTLILGYEKLLKKKQQLRRLLVRRPLPINKKKKRKLSANDSILVCTPPMQATTSVVPSTSSPMTASTSTSTTLSPMPPSTSTTLSPMPTLPSSTSPISGTINLSVACRQDHDYSFSSTHKLCSVCKDKDNVIASLVKKLSSLQTENTCLKMELYRQKYKGKQDLCLKG